MDRNWEFMSFVDRDGNELEFQSSMGWGVVLGNSHRIYQKFSWVARSRY